MILITVNKRTIDGTLYISSIITLIGVGLWPVIKFALLTHSLNGVGIWHVMKFALLTHSLNGVGIWPVIKLAQLVLLLAWIAKGTLQAAEDSKDHES